MLPVFVEAIPLPGDPEDACILRRLTAVSFAIARGSAAYYPAANPLVALGHHDIRSGTPAYKSIPIRIRRSKQAEDDARRADLTSSGPEGRPYPRLTLVPAPIVCRPRLRKPTNHAQVEARKTLSHQFDLHRFVDAQEPVIARVCGELGLGRKQSHWMWFVFPQLRGLGSSEMATFYGIEGLSEARAYLNHVTLGPRLVLCTTTVLDLEGPSLRSIFGSPDDMKFRSSMTLFAIAAHDSNSVFSQALGTLCDGMDDRTLSLIERREQSTAD